MILGLVALLAASGALLATARPVAACSCTTFTSMKDYATADNAVFTGTAAARDGRGVPVKVDRWLWGRGAAPVVWLAASSFGDSAACGTNPPPAGTAWIWVTWFPPERGDPTTGACSPSGELSTAEGKKMLAEAMQVFPAVVPQPTPEVTPGPVSRATPTVTTPPDPAAIARDQAGLTIAVALLAVVVVLFGGLTLLARRSSRRSERP